MSEDGRIRVQLLGELRVWRADGSEVEPDEWRTGKTTDLFRLLALEHGHVVRPAGLIVKLWPDVTDDRARNSLRTATSRIRQATHSTCVVRRLEGLVLEGAWVDAVEFRELAKVAHLAAREGDDARVLRAAEAAEDLHLGEFQAYDDESDWATTVREDLRAIRQEMLSEAAGAALALGQSREALDLATIAVRLDPTSETAHRALMRAHAELGEVANALRVFEGYRAHLAEELGADPSPETRELHMRLLRELT